MKTDLSQIVKLLVETYHTRAWKARSFFVADHERQIYAVLDIPDMPREFPAGIIVMARVVDDKVIIEEDITDKPLVDELVAAGIPREKIVLVYAGEALPAE